MNIKITNTKPSASQRAFSKPLEHEQKVEMKRLLFVEMLLRKMKSLGMKRKDLADKMGVVPARITKILRGNTNMTIDTLMRSAEAVDCDLYLHIAPKAVSVEFLEFAEPDVYPSFSSIQTVKVAESSFSPSLNSNSYEPNRAA